MKTYTMIGGVNGVGKSSYTGAIKNVCADLGEIIDVDKLIAGANNDSFKGGKIALQKINDCISKGVSFTQETTLSGHKTASTAKKAKAAGYRIRLYYIGLDTVEDSLMRIQNRVNRGGHNIPAELVKRRFHKRWEVLAKVLPYCDEAEFYDNHNGFKLVAEYSDGELRAAENAYPIWLADMKKYMNL